MAMLTQTTSKQVNLDNWTYTHYALADMKAKICLGGDIIEGEYQELYYVSILDAENQEVSQKEFTDLEMALENLNHGHQGWDFIDETLKISGSGCSSCVAH